MMFTRKEKLIEELITRHGGDAMMVLPTGAGKTFMRKSIEDYDTDELRRKADCMVFDEAHHIDTMTPAEFRRQYEQRFEPDSHATTALRYASTGYRKYNKEWESMLMSRGDYQLDGHFTTGASAEPDDNAMSFDELIDHMRNVRDAFMAGNASIPQRCGGYLPPNDELPTVDWEACRYVNPLYVQMLGRALRPRNYTWRMTRGKQPRKIKVWHKPKQRAITLDYNGGVISHDLRREIS